MDGLEITDTGKLKTGHTEVKNISTPFSGRGFYMKKGFKFGKIYTDTIIISAKEH